MGLTPYIMQLETSDADTALVYLHYKAVDSHVIEVVIDKVMFAKYEIPYLDPVIHLALCQKAMAEIGNHLKLENSK